MSTDANQLFETAVKSFADDMATNLTRHGFIGFTAVGSGVAPSCVLAVSGTPGVELFEKLMEIAPTLPEFHKMQAEAQRVAQEAAEQARKN